MLKPSRMILLLTLSQLGACAVISKTECLNADWNKVGYDVAFNGNTDKTGAFNIRKNTCEKHGASADWQDFENGYADGAVQYCQLPNAVKLGINGSSNTINNNACPAHDYPGFYNAFNKGYQLYVLNTHVRESHADVSSIKSIIWNNKQSIQQISKRLKSKDLDQSERKQLQHRRKKARDDIRYLARDLEYSDRRLHHDLYARDDYADYLYEDYLINLNTKFVDPRNRD